MSDCSDYNVECFFVVEPRRLDGATHHKQISPLFATKAEGQRFLSQVRPGHPDAYLGRYVGLFTPESEDDMRRREDLLDRIEPEGASHA